LDNALLHVRPVKNGVPSVHSIKGDKMRALRRLKREADKTEYVFVSELGSPIPFDTLVAACQRDRRNGDHSDGAKSSLWRYFGSSRNVPNGSLYNTAKDPNGVYYGGTYPGSDPDPNIRAALIREFGRQKF
jgi:hypothetical protein